MSDVTTPTTATKRAASPSSPERETTSKRAREAGPDDEKDEAERPELTDVPEDPTPAANVKPEATNGAKAVEVDKGAAVANKKTSSGAAEGVKMDDVPMDG